MRLSDEGQSEPRRHRGISARGIALQFRSRSRFESRTLRRSRRWSKPKKVCLFSTVLRTKTLFDLAFAGATAGKNVVIVIEKLSELEHTLEVVEELQPKDNPDAKLPMHRRARQTLFKRFGQMGKIGRRSGEIRSDDDRDPRSHPPSAGSRAHRYAPLSAFSYRLAADRHQTHQKRDEGSGPHVCKDSSD